MASFNAINDAVVNTILASIESLKEFLTKKFEDTDLEEIMSAIDEFTNEMPKPKKVKVTKKKDPNAPKKEPTAYILFTKENRPSVKEANPDLEAKEITKLLSQMWKEKKEAEGIETKPKKGKATKTKAPAIKEAEEGEAEESEAEVSDAEASDAEAEEKPKKTKKGKKGGKK
jgi:type IV secretory pathway VirB10-like protein